MNFTHNNHLKFGWGDGLYNFDNKDQQFWLKFEPAQYMPTSFKDECIRAARLIGESTQKKILLGLSGGVDSEVAARSFLDAGVDFEVATINIIHRGQIVNTHDTVYADSFAKKYGIVRNPVDIDFDDVVARLQQIRATRNPAEPYYKVSLPFLCHNLMFEQFCENYYCVTGAGDLTINPARRYKQTGNIQYGLNSVSSPMVSSVAPYELAARRGVGVTRFFCYTSEIVLSWLTNPDISHWIKYEKALMGDHCWMNIHAAKSFVMYKFWPDMEIRSKLGGWENIPQYESLYTDPHYSDPLSRSSIPVQEVLSMLLPVTP